MGEQWIPGPKVAGSSPVGFIFYLKHLFIKEELFQLIKNQIELPPFEKMQVSQEGVAPTVERWTPNPTVAGSNPVGLTFFIFM